MNVSQPFVPVTEPGSWIRPGRFDALCAGRDNNFNLLRMLAASGVLVSHAYPIALGPGVLEPLERALGGVTLGTVCVYVFFAISGFFITQSFERTSTLGRFVRARVLRLFPALAVVLVLTVAVGAGLSVAAASSYWAVAPDYVLRNLSLFLLRWELPGVFADNPYGGAINGSLWTLSYEVLCYFGVTLLGVAGILRRKWMVAVALALVVAGYFALQEVRFNSRVYLLFQLGLPFALGAAAYVWRDRIVLDARIALGLALLALVIRLLPGAEPLFRPVFVLALSYVTFWLGYLPIPALRAYNRLGDYSYGVYIYAFPAQQLVASWGAVTPGGNMALAALIVLPCAVLSWHLVEKPALALKAARRQV